MKLILIFIFGTLISCNKESYFSKKLIKGDSWAILSIKEDNVNLDLIGSWEILHDTALEAEVPRLVWRNEQSEERTFLWQFQDKGKNFQLSYQKDLTVPPTELDFFYYDISGVYNVKKHKNKAMTFESYNTVGFNGKKIEINISRN